MSLLKIENLRTYYYTDEGSTKAVDGVNFEISKGQVLGLAGESGCGKSTMALSILKIVPHPGKIVSGNIYLDGLNLTEMDGEEFRNKIRWKRISIIPQGSMNALNPVFKAGDQIAEKIQLHEKVNKAEAMSRAKNLLELVGVEKSRVNSYPHELSGGMKQRIMIAMALACDPELLIADEPTTALDVIVQAQIMNLLKDLQKRLHLSMILITHDLPLLINFCDTISIMYAGKIVEYADVSSLFCNPRHPYTRRLLETLPDIDSEKAHLTYIPGSPPSLLDPPTGCRFHPRCGYSTKICKDNEPQLKGVKGSQLVSCHRVRAREIQNMTQEIERSLNTRCKWCSRKIPVESVYCPACGKGQKRQHEELVAKVENLKKWFALRKRGFVGSLLSKGRSYVHAVDGVSFSLRKNEILGLVGESGCGKTTTGRLLIGLEQPTEGEVYLGDKAILSISREELRELRQKIQMIFQDPYESLNPKMNVFDIVAEGLVINKLVKSRHQMEGIVGESLEAVGLNPPESFYEKYPHELSGGQRQRVAIARALVLRPEVIVADEPVSMLDASIRASVLDILLNIREKLSISCLYITHDLALARHLCDRIIIMYLGKIVEAGPTEQIVREPLHPYTVALLASVPRPEPTSLIEVLAPGGIPSSVEPPKGCRFHPRCLYSIDICSRKEPKLLEKDGHYIACHRAGDFSSKRARACKH